VPRRARRSAGADVLARAERFSNELLVEEEACFAAIGFVFAAGLPDALIAVDKGWRRAKASAKALAADVEVLTSLLSLTADATTLSVPIVAGLASKTVDLSLEAISDELDICEATVGTRYAGVATEGVEQARDAAVGIVTKVLAKYEDVATSIAENMRGEYEHQMRVAALYEEPKEKVYARLFSTEALKLPANGGRGLWWRPTTGLSAAARNVAISLANEVREAAMNGMNDAAKRR
jgi:hypothetical protein